MLKKECMTYKIFEHGFEWQTKCTITVLNKITINKKKVDQLKYIAFLKPFSLGHVCIVLKYWLRNAGIVGLKSIFTTKKSITENLRVLSPLFGLFYEVSFKSLNLWHLWNYIELKNTDLLSKRSSETLFYLFSNWDDELFKPPIIDLQVLLRHKVK